MRIKMFCLALTVIFIESCAPMRNVVETASSSPPSRTALYGQPSLTFVVPVSTDLVQTYNAISPLRYTPSGTPQTRVGFETGKGDLYVTMQTGNRQYSLEEKSTSYSMVLFDVRRETSGETETITFTPKAVEQKKGIGTLIPRFGLSDAIWRLKTAEILLKFETDSQYDPDSVFSNFKRRYGYSLHEDDPKGRRGTINSYYGNGTYNCKFQVWPYKGGSKTTFTVRYEVAGYKEKGDKLDLTERLRTLKESLVAVVNG